MTLQACARFCNFFFRSFYFILLRHLFYFILRVRAALVGRLQRTCNARLQKQYQLSLVTGQQPHSTNQPSCLLIIMATSGDISFTMALNWQITAVRTFFPYMECMYSAFKFTGGSREFRQTRHSVSYHCIRSSSVGYIQYKCLRFCLMCIRNCASIIVSCREV